MTPVALPPMASEIYTLHVQQRVDRIDRWIVSALDEQHGVLLSRRAVRRCIDAGRVKVDGRRHRVASRGLRPGQQVEIDVGDENVSDSARELYQLSAAQIIFEDELVIAVNKPSGLPSQGTRDPNRDHLVAALQRYLTARDGQPPYLALHHRLDLETSGVIVLAKDRRANKGLTDAFRDRAASKQYRALTVFDGVVRAQALGAEASPGQVSPTWEVENHLARRPRRKGPSVTESVRSGGDYARTAFALHAWSDRAAEVLAKPWTGRTHQIRAHLSEAGAPILGDRLYGGPIGIGDEDIARLMLHAEHLELPHPAAAAARELHAPTPHEWRRLRAALID